MQAARRLSRRSYREQDRAFRVEGLRAVADALASSWDIGELFVSEDTPAIQELVAIADVRGVTVTRVTPQVMRGLTDTVTPQGVIAVVSLPEVGLEPLLSDADLVLVLAEVRDPGNAGTLVRSAAAAGASVVLFTTGAVDPFSPKTVRAAAGAIFHVPVVAGYDLEGLAGTLRAAGLSLIGAAAAGGRPLGEIDLTARVALVLGNEAWGIGPAATDVLDDIVSIPMPGNAESLNVGIAGSIVLFEAVRQRRLSSSTI